MSNNCYVYAACSFGLTSAIIMILGLILFLSCSTPKLLGNTPAEICFQVGYGMLIGGAVAMVVSAVWCWWLNG